ncbi:hypothetical protein GR160_02860 [Flavobacterium sp. Sd200]|uniref:hypothetical protein n=1 Tax=Flavobacterium sp. Sd200 TaxID=2692211 RepID=UPI0013713BB3|nr:hypothetical protein [Flavobacterium sp. Sd200]MXN90154.1 hypothetical protein [Flavobacterium sp. Sd200]
MPYTIRGKVLDEFGEPIGLGDPMGHPVVITEKPSVPGGLTIADVWAEPDGSYTISALSSTSRIEISAYGYSTQSFAATAVPSIVQLQVDPALVISGTTKPPVKKNYNWVWAAAAIALLAGVAMADKSKPKPTRTGATKAKAKTGLGKSAVMVVV